MKKKVIPIGESPIIGFLKWPYTSMYPQTLPWFYTNFIQVHVKKKKVLPIGESPIIGFLKWPYTLSITSMYPQTLPWFYTNFIQVHVNKYFLQNGSQCNFNFFRGGRWELNNNNPFIISNTLHNNILRTINSNFQQFLIDAIDNGYYVIAFIDEYFISSKAAYQQYHFPHHLMIYGYSMEEKLFYTIGFNEQEVFSRSQVSFIEMGNAYKSINTMIENSTYRDHPDESTFLFKFNSEFEYQFNTQFVLDQINEYLHSESSIDLLNYSNSTSAFGIETYDYLIAFYEALHTNNLPNRTGIIRHLHILWEHKKTMSERIKYMMASQYIMRNEETINELDEIEKQALILRNIGIKYNVTNNVSLLMIIINRLREIKEREEIALKSILYSNKITYKKLSNDTP